MVYDDAGNLEARTDFMGRVTTYGYDVNNRLLSRTHPNADENVSFTYTPTGRRLTTTDSRGTTEYAYDTRDRLASLTYPDGRALQYEHDAQGNRVKLTALLAGLSLVTTSAFDPLNRLETVADPVDRIYTHGYDENGNRGALLHPNGVETVYTYGALNRLTNLSTTHPGLGRTIQTYAFTLGPSGNRTRIDEHDGSVHQYTYDHLYRLTGESVSDSIALVYDKTFAYDPVGNRLAQTTTLGPSGSPGPHLGAGALGYTYDTRDRLLTEQLEALPETAHNWDTNGNLTTKDGEGTYTWDHENRLIQITKTDGTVVEHAYDADGNRVRTTVTPPTGPPTTAHFLVDTSGSLSHVVAETDDTGALQAHYVRGDDLLAVMRPLVPVPATAMDWQTRYFHADGLGSIRRLTDDAANITDGYTYFAFGELLAHTGTDPQPYAFTGEPLDPNSGWQYHRARWMDPTTGRFTGMDPFDGRLVEPASLHRYLYANGDPAGRTDPSGKESIVISSQAAAMIATLAVASFATLQAARMTAAGNLADATTDAAVGAFELGSYAVQRAVAAAETAIAATHRSLSDLIEKAREIVQAPFRSATRTRAPKVVPMPAAIIPDVAAHVASAQLSHPMLLTRTTRAQARINRRNAIGFHSRAGTGLSLDEYPFASSIQGGFGASVQIVPIRENLVQGGIIAASYMLQGIAVGDDFFVVVIP